MFFKWIWPHWPVGPTCHSISFLRINFSHNGVVSTLFLRANFQMHSSRITSRQTWETSSACRRDSSSSWMKMLRMTLFSNLSFRSLITSQETMAGNLGVRLEDRGSITAARERWKTETNPRIRFTNYLSNITCRHRKTCKAHWSPRGQSESFRYISLSIWFVLNFQSTKRYEYRCF